jgi:hypothetical protein
MDRVWERGTATLRAWRWVMLVCILIVTAPRFTAAATFNCATATDFTNALTNSALGDTIVLTAGNTFTGSFTLPNKTTGTGYITIQSSAVASLPATGTRVTPTNAGNMPKVVSSGFNAPAIRTAVSAHHFKLIGLEIIGPANNSVLNTLVALGDSGTAQDTLAEVANNLVIDRCIVRAFSTTQTLRRGIALNSGSTDITNCYVAGCKEAGADSQAVGGWNGPGPYNIINNYLEGAGENVIFGGSDPSIPNLVTEDIVFKRNYCFKPLSWKIGDPSYAGTPWTVKNLFELKNARRVVIDGNLFENNWVHGQAGVAILFTPRNQNGTAPWVVVEDVDYTNNILKNSVGGYNILGYDDAFPSQQTKRVKIQNNLDYQLTGNLYLMLAQTANITINHNTSFHAGNYISVDGAPHTGFVCTNNMAAHNNYGVIGSDHGVGNDSLNFFYGTPTFTKNVLMGGPSSLYSQYPGNFFTASWSGVLVNQASPGTNFAGWKVVTGSAYDNTATDGKDIGADIDAINTATAGCVSGVWGSTPPPGGGGTTTVTLKNGLNGYSGNTSFGVDGQSPTTNLGPNAYLHLANQLSGTNGYVTRAFYKFNLSQAASGIPANAVITSASLQLQTDWSGGNADGTIKIHRVAPVNNAFAVNYSTATRNTYNGVNAWTGGANAAGDVANSNNDYLDTPDSTSTLPAEGTAGTFSFNVTSSVQAWVNGSANNGWIVLPAARSAYLGTSADLHGSSNFPVLTVTYQSSAPPTSITKTLKNGVNGYTGAVSFAADGQTPSTYHGANAYLLYANNLPSTNFYFGRPFYKFDLTQGANAIPANAVIESATLKLKIEYSAGSTDAGIKIHRVKPVNNAFTVNYAAATANTYNGVNTWTGGNKAGGDASMSNNDFIDTPDATGTLPADGNYMSVNVTSSVQAWVNGEANNGWLCIPNGRTVYMGTTADLHGSGDYPELTITYH